MILSERRHWRTSLAKDGRTSALNDILRVGTSAGGARAKAVIAWNRQTHEVRSGQADAGSGFVYWLPKLDGVTGNGDKALQDPKGCGAIVDQVREAVARWPEFAETARVPEASREEISRRLRLSFPKT